MPHAANAQHPVVQVTWHGAEAICAWFGKRLCSAQEWQDGCGGVERSEYPYGTAYDSEACNGLDLGEDSTMQVGSLTTCEGGLTELFDMSGNVYEWSSSCEDGPCLIHGGSFDKQADELTCDGSHTMDGPSGHREDLGVRCCSGPES